MTLRSPTKKTLTLFKKYEGNPILTRMNWPYPVSAVINPGAQLLNRETVLLVRAEHINGNSHFTVARSSDGFTNWEIDSQPTMEADPNSKEEKGGLFDPRILFLKEQKQFAITYISVSEGGPVVSLAITKNFKTFARLGSLTQPHNKDASLFPHRFRGRFALIHSPFVPGEAYIWISFSPDLKHWGDHRRLLGPRVTQWDRHRVGLACEPIETQAGWLLFYYGVCNTTSGPIYRVGLALLHLQEPWRVLRRSNECVLEPTEVYERVGDAGEIVFPTGATVDKNTKKLNLYYGTAECSIAVASANLDDLLDYVVSCPKVE